MDFLSSSLHLIGLWTCSAGDLSQGRLYQLSDIPNLVSVTSNLLLWNLTRTAKHKSTKEKLKNIKLNKIDI